MGNTTALTGFLQNLIGAAPAPVEQLAAIAANLPADMSNADIKNTLRLLAAIPKIGAGADDIFTVKTDAFEFVAASLAATETSTLSVGGGDISIAIPPLPAELAAAGISASVIVWTTSPYDSLAPAIDTPVLSIEISSSSGQSLEVANLPQPIRFSYALPPETRASRLPTNISYACVAPGLFQLDDGAGQRNTTQCPSGLAANISCVFASEDTEASPTVTWQNYTCDPPILAGDCIYWDTRALNWSSSGCRAVAVTPDTMTCECTHLTDFGGRISAIFAANAAIFRGFADIYNAETARRLWKFYTFFGSWALGAAVLIAWLAYLDHKAARIYLHRLITCTEVNELFKLYPPDTALDRLMPHPTDEEIVDAAIETTWPSDRPHPLIPTGRWRKFIFAVRIYWQRLFYQHSYFSVYFRFDPRLSRAFRALFIMTSLMHTLFITALLYGYMHGAPADGEEFEPPTIGESLLLSVLTSLLNVAFVRVLFTFMNAAGTSEFRWRYPILYEELLRRHKMEEALCNLSTTEIVEEVKRVRAERFRSNYGAHAIRDGISASTDNDSEPTGYGSTNNNSTIAQDGDILDYIFLIARCKKPVREKQTHTLATARALLGFAIRELKEPVRGCRRWLPVHTRRGWFAICIPVAWFTWCIQYLLAFAASRQADVADDVFQSYGFSQLMTIFGTQPIALFATMMLTIGLYYLTTRCCPRRAAAHAHRGIKALEFLSDPMAGKGSTALSASFAYWLFLRAPADASLSTPWTQHMDIACATVKAATGFLRELVKVESTDTPADPEMAAAAPESTDTATVEMPIDDQLDNALAPEKVQSCENRTIMLYALWRGQVA